jgi:hypothetical protein
MPTLALTNFNIVCSVLGGFITLFGLVSYLFKEKFYLSEARKLSSNTKPFHRRSLIYLPQSFLCWQALSFLHMQQI